jgi:RNA-binding protein
MSELTGKQKRHLRGLGQKLRADAVVGKAGLTGGVIDVVREMLSGRELVKVRLPPGAGAARRQHAQALARAVGATCVGLVGRAALLYRPEPSLPAEMRVPLPPG